MKHAIYTTAVIFLLASSPAKAQNDFFNPSAEVFEASGQNLFSKYFFVNSRDDVQQTALLDIIYSKTLPATQNNTNDLIKAYRATDSESQKMALLRLLGQMYDQGDTQIKNTSIDVILSGTRETQFPKAAGEAVRIYSESGYFLNSISVLDSARESKLIDSDSYSASLAKLMLAAPPGSIRKIAEIIGKENNRRALDILNLTFSSATPDTFPHASKEVILELLEKNEPEFPEDESRMGALDAIRYDTWLHASANLSEAVTGEDRNSFIDKKLSANSIDDRKLVAYLISSPEESLTLTKKSNAALQKIRQAVLARSRAYPEDTLTAEARRRLEQ